jgi:hypothetical protein
MKIPLFLSIFTYKQPEKSATLSTFLNKRFFGFL